MTLAAGLGSRFRRPLTDRELDSVRTAARRDGPADGLHELWTLILRDAEGVTWDEAVDRGLKFTPSDYAIPYEQARDVLETLKENQPRSLRVGVSVEWLNIGPASYEPTDWPGDETASAVSCLR